MDPKTSGDTDRKLTYSFPELEGEKLLAELVLYVAHKCKADTTFGAVKLNKILFFADFAAYLENGKPITGVAYEKLQYGPVPRPINAVLAALERDGAITRLQQRIFDHEQKRIVANKSANVDLFTAREIALVDEIIETLWDRTAVEVSNISHGIAWKSAEDRELIPYEAFLLSDEELSEDEIRRAEELIRTHGWGV